MFPLLGAFELVAQFVQTHNGPHADDYRASHAFVKEGAKETDAIVFAPSWSDPVGRKEFADLLTPERVAYVDESHFARAFVVGVRGASVRGFAAWPQKDERSFGALTVRVLENPHFEPNLDTLSRHVSRAQLDVSQGSSPCRFQSGTPSAPTWGFGTPRDRFSCGSGFVGVITVPSLDYLPRRCILAPGTPTDRPLTLTFHDVHFGRRIAGHQGIHATYERNLTHAPVTASFYVRAIQASGALEEREIGSAIHRDGTGWGAFEIDTRPISGETGDLIVRISSPANGEYPYCFDADTR